MVDIFVGGFAIGGLGGISIGAELLLGLGLDFVYQFKNPDVRQPAQCFEYKVGFLDGQLYLDGVHIF